MNPRIEEVRATRGAARYRVRHSRRQRLLCACLLLAAAVAVGIIGWPVLCGACATMLAALAGAMLAPLDPP